MQNVTVQWVCIEFEQMHRGQFSLVVHLTICYQKDAGQVDFWWRERSVSGEKGAGKNLAKESERGGHSLPGENATEGCGVRNGKEKECQLYGGKGTGPFTASRLSAPPGHEFRWSQGLQLWMGECLGCD